MDYARDAIEISMQHSIPWLRLQSAVGDRHAPRDDAPLLSHMTSASNHDAAV